MKVKIEFASWTCKAALEIEAESKREAIIKAVQEKADLRWANLSEADLREADLRGANLSWANLSEADLSEADLRWANLSEADLSEANLRWANLSEADLSEADLRWANLSEADLRWANLRGANLREADLRRADLDYSCWPLWCGSVRAKIDKKIASQLLYHTLRAMQSVDDDECREILANKKVLELANKFHRAEQCGLFDIPEAGK